jgi:hypothetical protein
LIREEQTMMGDGDLGIANCEVLLKQIVITSMRAVRAEQTKPPLKILFIFR